MNSQLTKGHSVDILLVEDNIAHATLIQRTLQEQRIANHLYHVTDGEAALDYLYQRGKFDDSGQYPRPELILLDLRLPKIDGLEVLQNIKSDPLLMTIPVVILSTSKAEEDLARAYHAHANSYIVKPMDFDKFQQVMSDIGYYWLIWNQKPAE